MNFAEGSVEGHSHVLWIHHWQDAEAKYYPSDDLLHEYFKRCVLVNVKGAVRPAGYWLWLDPEIDYDLSSFLSGDRGSAMRGLVA